jgi:predicted transcriptional regulator
MAERAERITVRLSPMLLQRLDALAAARGLTRSACLRALVTERALTPAQEVPDERELMQIRADATGG